MAVWEKWREARVQGKPVGAIWKKGAGGHLQNEVQMVDDQNVSVAAGNKYGGAWVQAYPDKVVVIYYDAQDKELRREEVATTPDPHRE